MRNYIYIFSVAIFFCCGTSIPQANKQKCEEKIIFLDYSDLYDCDYNFRVLLDPHFEDYRINNTYYEKRKDLIFKIELQSCAGQATITAYDSLENIVLQGQYINGLDIMRSYEVAEEVKDRRINTVVYVDEYYQPLKDGLWKYFEDGKLVDLSLWKDGTIVRDLPVDVEKIP